MLSPWLIALIHGPVVRKYDDEYRSVGGCDPGAPLPGLKARLGACGGSP
jgi:hypothetical protein